MLWMLLTGTEIFLRQSKSLEFGGHTPKIGILRNGSFHPAGLKEVFERGEGEGICKKIHYQHLLALAQFSGAAQSKFKFSQL